MEKCLTPKLLTTLLILYNAFAPGNIEEYIMEEIALRISQDRKAQEETIFLFMMAIYSKKEKIGYGLNYWRCVKYQSEGCLCRCTANRGELISQKEHSHGPDPNQVDARRVLNHVKENARTSQFFYLADSCIQ
ncbi:hypothetical protein RF11_10323 [Thelohanellus kitauei]|uniref:FLYWCH-type domain-containing protein n=1 Tax=Thelohanellus kitauei TaxID=669202 RepID=A0A0C2MPZ9_THEKT|nr:hypothetical protein RF11_10323 [Thelohanellus kitauei]